jgi:metal-sulfur cluster biosynthetic enzyme
MDTRVMDNTIAAGMPGNEGALHEPAPTPDDVKAALRRVIDPEVGLDIVTMGLVYGVDVDPQTVTLTYTLTTPGCPLADYMRRAIEHAVLPLLGGRRLDAQLVFEPEWTPELIEGGAW